MTRLGNVSLMALILAAAVVFGTVASALESTTPSLSEGPESKNGDPLRDLIPTDVAKVDLQTCPPEAYETDAEFEPPEVQEVPEPATVVSLAGLAAMAGAALLVRLRWFRRR